jgi:dolichol-phosphate mannosyltransferase
MTAGRKITVVVPTYNERDNLPTLVDFLAGLDLPDLHLLVVDDDSPDGTGEIADKLAITAPIPIAVLHRSTKDGLGRAYVAGISHALSDAADIVIQMDADLSHPCAAIPQMVEILDRNEAAVVIGSRYVDGGEVASDWPMRRRMLSTWANRYVNTILQLGVRDATAGFKAWRADALHTIDVTSIASNGYAFQVEMNYRAARAGLPIVEVPIRFEDRTNGRSKMSASVQAESALLPWRLLVNARLNGRRSTPS